MKKIIFIDDNKLILKTVKSLLESPTCEFYCAQNGFDGLCEMIENKPDIIFIEASAAKLDGFQFCALVKSKAEYSHIALIIILDKEDQFERSKAEAVGAEKVLSKPFSKAELLAVITGQESKAA